MSDLNPRNFGRLTRLRLVTFKGGMSFGALTLVSENGIKSFGSVAVTSKPTIPRDL